MVLLLFCRSLCEQALVETLLLAGGTPFANFRDLAHAWGREKGFHTVLASAIFERRGEVERKRRSPSGKTVDHPPRQQSHQQQDPYRRIITNSWKKPRHEVAREPVMASKQADDARLLAMVAQDSARMQAEEVKQQVEV
jgi:hypothetical protein